MNEALIVALRARARVPAKSTDHVAGVASVSRPPVESIELERAETTLGRRLPPVLRAVYLNVSGGNFGPGYGLLPLFPEDVENGDDSVVDLYSSFSSPDPEDPAWLWPQQLVPFCDWGCAIRSCIDCSSDAGAVVTFDPNAHAPGKPLSSAFAQTHSSIEAWFSDWLAGVNIWELMYEPDPENSKVGINPFTKQPHTFNATRLRRT